MKLFQQLSTLCCNYPWLIFKRYWSYFWSQFYFPTVCVSHHGWSSLFHTAKDEGLAVFPDLILSIPQPVHQSRQNYGQQKESSFNVSQCLTSSLRTKGVTHGNRSSLNLNHNCNTDRPQVECIWNTKIYTVQWYRVIISYSQWARESPITRTVKEKWTVTNNVKIIKCYYVSCTQLIQQRK